MAHTLHPSAVACSSITLCPPGEEMDVRDRIEEALKSTPYDQASTFVVATEDEYKGKWGPQRLFVPHRVGIVGAAKPLVPSEGMVWLSKTKAWTPFVFIMVILSVVLMTVGTRDYVSDNVYWVLSPIGLTLMLIVLGMQLSTYSRAMCFQLIKSFDFWYLAIQVLAATSATSFWIYNHRGEYYTIPLRTLADIVSGACVFLMDASAASRIHKGVVMAAVCAGLATWAFLWNRDTSEAATYTVNIYLFEAKIRTIASTAMATLSAFAARYACAALFMKHDAMMLKFAPRLVRLEHVTVEVPDDIFEGESRGDVDDGGEAIGRRRDDPRNWLPRSSQTFAKETDTSSGLPVGHIVAGPSTSSSRSVQMDDLSAPLAANGADDVLGTNASLSDTASGSFSKSTDEPRGRVRSRSTYIAAQGGAKLNYGKEFKIWRHYNMRDGSNQVNQGTISSPQFGDRGRSMSSFAGQNSSEALRVGSEIVAASSTTNSKGSTRVDNNSENNNSSVSSPSRNGLRNQSVLWEDS